MERELEAHVRRAICARLAEFKNHSSNNLPARTRRYASMYALTITVAAVAARYHEYVHPGDSLLHLHPWMTNLTNFVDDAMIILAICVLVLEASMYVKILQAVEAARLGDLSNVMTWLAVMLGACGFVARLFQRGAKAEEAAGPLSVVMLFWAVGLELVLGVIMGSIALVVFGEKLRKRA